MESKKLKLKVHHRNFSGKSSWPQSALRSTTHGEATDIPTSLLSAAEDLIVNIEALSKEKFEIREGDLLEIFPTDDHRTTWRYISTFHQYS